MHKWVELLVQFIGLFQCWTYIDPNEETLILRRGLLHRICGPGWRWLWPIGFEDNITASVVPEPAQLEVQSLHSSDDYSVNICVGMEYQIVDIKVHELDFDETETTNMMIAAGVISDMVRETKFKDIDGRAVASLRGIINRKIKKRGARFTEVCMTDLSNGAAVRYWHEGIDLDFGED